MIEVWGASGASSDALSNAASEDGRERERGKGRGERVLLLKCKLAQASIHLQRDEVRTHLDSILICPNHTPLQMEACHRLLIEVLRDPLLTQSFSSSYSIMAQATMLTSHYLQHQGTTPLPLDRFLHHLHSPSSSSSSHDRFVLTELELSLEALKLLRAQANTHAVCASRQAEVEREEVVVEEEEVCLEDVIHVEEEEEEESEASNGLLRLSTTPTAWEVMDRLLRCLLDVGQLFLWQGAVQEGVHYLKEGLALARRMCLSYWYLIN